MALGDTVNRTAQEARNMAQRESCLTPFFQQPLPGAHAAPMSWGEHLTGSHVSTLLKTEGPKGMLSWTYQGFKEVVLKDSRSSGYFHLDIEQLPDNMQL